MELAAKLQIKPGMQVAALAVPAGGPDLSALGPRAAAPDSAAAVIVFVHHAADLEQAAGPAIEAARQDRLAWIAYPKAGQLGTDLNRDRLARAMLDRGVQPVRQVSIDEVWSALRFRPG
ncbi:MAG TPA: hypothetical protein VGI58_09515 [Streptosporangiaceae bacterium]